MPGATGAHPITVTSMDANLNWIANFIWGIADDTQQRRRCDDHDPRITVRTGLAHQH